MQRIRLLQLGDVDLTFASNAVRRLESVQSAYLIDFGGQKIAISVESKNGLYDDDEISTLGASFCRQQFPEEYPISICDLPLTEDLCSTANSDGAILNLREWKTDYPGESLDRIFAFEIADILISRRVSLGVHYDTRGCPSDYCENAADLLIGLRKCEYCAECQAAIRQALRNEQLSIREIAAVSRIFDWVSGRKRAFVIMPFGGKFDEVYRSAIKPSVESVKWICGRVDEVRRPAEIIDLIWEEIHRATLVIADLTGRNPNVFYELGYADALGIPIVLLCQKIEEVPFDIRHRQVVIYSPKRGGLEHLAKSLGDYIGTL